MRLVSTPSTNDLAFGSTTHADSRVFGKLVGHESAASSDSGTNNHNDGVGGRVTQPVLLVVTLEGSVGVAAHEASGRSGSKEGDEDWVLSLAERNSRRCRSLQLLQSHLRSNTGDSGTSNGIHHHGRSRFKRRMPVPEGEETSARH